MSLINQMLQDLDARRAAESTGGALPNDVRPWPALRSSRWPMLAGIGALVVLAGGAAWYGLSVRTTVVASVPHQQPPALPAASPSLAAAVASPATDPVTASALNAPAGLDAELRLATSLRLPENWADVPTPLAALERVPTGIASVKPVAKPSVSRPAVAVVSPTRDSVVAASPQRTADTVSIEKSVPSGAAEDRAETEYRRAQTVLNQGRTPEALDALRLALKLNSAHFASRQLLLKLLVENKQLDEADGVLREGLVQHPAQIAWAMSLARLQLDRGDLPAAWKTLEHSLPSAAASSDYQGFAGHLLQRQGRASEAVDYYQAATRLAPSEGRWWLGLGLVLEADGRTAPAHEAYANARASKTLSPDLRAYVEQKLR